MSALNLFSTASVIFDRVHRGLPARAFRFAQKADIRRAPAFYEYTL
jgi:hypothetical protein